jgi:hypothetical protein
VAPDQSPPNVENGSPGCGVAAQVVVLPWLTGDGVQVTLPLPGGRAVAVTG